MCSSTLCQGVPEKKLVGVGDRTGATPTFFSDVGQERNQSEVPKEERNKKGRKVEGKPSIPFGAMLHFPCVFGK